jgi:hypothetical protein
MPQERTLYRASGNGTGATVDTGLNSLANKLNLDFKLPRTITAITITINSSPDNSVFTLMSSYSNVFELTGTLQMMAPHRYYNAVVTGYTGSGLVLITCEPGEVKSIA